MKIRLARLLFGGLIVTILAVFAWPLPACNSQPIRPTGLRRRHGKANLSTKTLTENPGRLRPTPTPTSLAWKSSALPALSSLLRTERPSLRGFRPGRPRAPSALDARHGLDHRLDHQAVHRRGILSSRKTST